MERPDASRVLSHVRGAAIDFDQHYFAPLIGSRQVCYPSLLFLNLDHRVAAVSLLEGTHSPYIPSIPKMPENEVSSVNHLCFV